jgi:hypothetical protein
VIHRRSCLVLAIAHSLYGVIGAGAARSLVDAAVAISCGLLVTLFAPLLAGLGALLSTLDGDARRCFPAADRVWLMSCHIGTCGVMRGDATPSFSGALGGIGQLVERSRKCSALCVASGRPCQRPPGVAARPPLSTGIIVAQVPRVSFRLYAYLLVLLMCRGSTCGPGCHSET